MGEQNTGQQYYGYAMFSKADPTNNLLLICM